MTNNCLNCSNPIISKSAKKFCCQSCTATYNNQQRILSGWRRTTESKIKASKSSVAFHAQAGHNKHPGYAWKKFVSGPFTRIYLCTCKISGKQWYDTSIRSIHSSMIATKKQYAYQCRFTFGLTLYSQWFQNASILIKQYGWYSASNRGNNTNGCSRDHLYSITDGFNNQVLPNIMSHPANCEIMPHKQNQRKNVKSSITLDELYNRIKQFDAMYGEQCQIQTDVFLSE